MVITTTASLRAVCVQASRGRKRIIFTLLRSAADEVALVEYTATKYIAGGKQIKSQCSSNHMIRNHFSLLWLKGENPRILSDELAGGAIL